MKPAPVYCDIHSFILHFVLVNSVLYKLVRCMYILLLTQRLDLKHNRLILVKIKNLVYVHLCHFTRGSATDTMQPCASCDMSFCTKIAKNICVPHQTQHVKASKDNIFIEDITNKVRFNVDHLSEAKPCTILNRLAMIAQSYIFCSYDCWYIYCSYKIIPQTFIS